MKKISIAGAGAALLWTFSLAAPSAVGAQRPVLAPDVRIERLPQGLSLIMGAPNRAVIGVTLARASRADTAGVRIEEVAPDGPAAKAGLKPGMIITAIDGVSLRVSAADAADPQLAGLAQRRLTRTLEDAKAGDDVELRVLDGSQARTVRLKTVAASELQRAAVGEAVPELRGVIAGRAESLNRAAVGLSIGVSGTVRDTFGLFVSAVTPDGPAEKAGIIEGDRIAAINGVDLRVPKEDVEDAQSAMARVSRFTRELEKATAGDKVTLRVWNAGRYRDVPVTTVKTSELPKGGFRMHIGDGRVFIGSGEGIPGVLREFSGSMPQIWRFDDSRRPAPDRPDRLDRLDRLDRVERERIEQLMQELRERVQRDGSPRTVRYWTGG